MIDGCHDTTTLLIMLLVLSKNKNNATRKQFNISIKYTV